MTTHSRLHVLVVEADPGLQHLLSVVFHRQGWHVAAEERVEPALELLHAGWADVVVIDVLLHHTSGLEILAGISRANGSWFGHVIVLTALPQKVLDGLLKTHAVCHVVTKPFDITNLVAQVESCAQAPSVFERRAVSETIQ